jgi:hypothetical protein
LELSRTMLVLCRMLVIRYTLEGKNKKDFRYAMNNVIRDILLPLGVTAAEAFITKKLT